MNNSDAIEMQLRFTGVDKAAAGMDKATATLLKVNDAVLKAAKSSADTSMKSIQAFKAKKRAIDALSTSEMKSASLGRGVEAARIKLLRTSKEYARSLEVLNKKGDEGSKINVILAARNVKLAASHLKAAKNASRQAKELDRVGKSSKAISETIRRTSRLTAVLEGPLGPVAGRLTAISTAIRTMGATAVTAGLAVAGAIAALRIMAPAAADLQVIMGSLSATVNDVDAAFSLIKEEADRTGQNISIMSKSFANFSAAAKGTSLEGAKVEAVFKAINTVTLALRLSPARAAGAFKALEQMISKGKVSAEELRGQLGEQLPGAFRIAADSMGLTTAELNKQLQLGTILAEDLLPKLAVALEKRFGAAAARASGQLAVAVGRVQNSFFLFSSSLISDKSLDSLSNILNSISNRLKVLSDNSSKVSAVFKVMARDIGLTVVVFAVIKKSLSLYNTGVLAATFNTRKFRRTIKRATIAAIRFNRAVRANPWISAAVALAGLVAVTKIYSDVTDAATTTTKKRSSALDNEITRLKHLIKLNEVLNKPNELAKSDLRLATAKNQLKDIEKEQNKSIILIEKYEIDVEKIGNRIIKEKARQSAIVSALSVDSESKAVQDRAKIEQRSIRIKGIAVRFRLKTLKDNIEEEQKKIKDSDNKIKAIRRSINNATTKNSALNSEKQKKHMISANASILRLGIKAANIKAKTLTEIENKRFALEMNKLKENRDLLAASKDAGPVSNIKRIEADRAIEVARAQHTNAMTNINADIVSKDKDSKRKLSEVAAKALDKFKQTAASAITISNGEFARIDDETRRKKDVLRKQYDNIDDHDKRVLGLHQAFVNANAAIDETAKVKKDEFLQRTLDAEAGHYENIAQQNKLFGASKLEAEQARYENSVSTEIERFGVKFDSLQHDADAEKSLTREFEKSQEQAEQLHAKKMRSLKEAELKIKFSMVSGVLGDIAGLMQSGNKKAFEIGKIAAISQAGIDGVSAAISAWKKGMDAYGLPGAIAMSAISVLKTGMMIRKLSSAHFGGGAMSASSGSSSSGIGPSSAPVKPPTFDPAFRAIPTTPAVARAGTPPIQIVQHITAPGSQAGQEQAIAVAAQIATQQAVAAIGQDFNTNGPLRQALAV